MPLKTREVLRLFVMTITSRIICSYKCRRRRMPAYCGGDNEIQLSNETRSSAALRSSTLPELSSSTNVADLCQGRVSRLQKANV